MVRRDTQFHYLDSENFLESTTQIRKKEATRKYRKKQRTKKVESSKPKMKRIDDQRTKSKTQQKALPFRWEPNKYNYLANRGPHDPYQKNDYNQRHGIAVLRKRKMQRKNSGNNIRKIYQYRKRDELNVQTFLILKLQIQSISLNTETRKCWGTLDTIQKYVFRWDINIKCYTIID